MKRIIMLFVALVISATFFKAEAQELNINVLYKYSEMTVLVTGNSVGNPTEAVDIIIVKGEGCLEDLNKGMKPTGFFSTKTKFDYTYEALIPFGSDTDAGLYTVIAVSNGHNVSSTFIFVNEQQAKHYVSDVNNAANNGAVKEILNVAYESFGLTKEDYQGNSTFISSVVFSLKPTGGYKSALDIYSVAQSGVVAGKIKSGGDIDSILKENEEVLSIEYEEFNSLSTNVKAVLQEKLKNADYNSSSFGKIYYDSLCVSQISGAENWQKMKTAVIKYSVDIGINLDGEYKSVSNKDNVFQIMYKKNLIDKIAISNSFNKAITEILSAQNSSNETSGNSGGASSSSGSGGSYSIDSATINEINNVEIFTDINAHWAKEDILYLYEKEIINGYNDHTFCPDKMVTRAEFVKLMTLAFTISGKENINFSDVNSRDWYYDCVKKAAGSEIIYGYDGFFHPNSPITRQDSAVILYRVLKYGGFNILGTNSFPDSCEIAEYALVAVEALSENGILSGTKVGFEPENFTTRAQAVRMIVNMMKFESGV